MFQVFLLISSCFLLGFNTAIDTIRINEPVRDPETLISNGQNFKLGFFSPPSSSYRYVGVLYNIPVMTAIWVANRDKPLNDSNGILEISGDGNLVILDGLKEIVWSTDLTNSVANTSAQLLDTGNLVLQDNLNGRIIWESFQHASDSLVRRMVITADSGENGENSLTSWRNTSDPALGSFTAAIEPLEIPELVIFIRLPEMTFLYQNRFDLVNDHPGPASMTFTYSNRSVLLYFVLNMSGILQEKVWYDGLEDWEVVWSSIDNDCDVYGKCGPFGSCNAQDKPICICWPGFDGCTRKTPFLCEKNNSIVKMEKQDTFFMLTTVKLPDRAKWSPTSEADCGNLCLNNCSCMAYAYYAGIGCMLWTKSLFDVHKFSKSGAGLYIRLAYSELDNMKNWKAIIATTVILESITVTGCSYFTWKWLVKYIGSQQRSKFLSSEIGETDPRYSKETMLKNKFCTIKIEELPLFRFEMLSKATGNFDSIHMLGQGGFGPVYKGKLPNRQEIAVKRLARSSNQGLEEFMNEVEVISKLQHRNLVRLISCCVEGEEKMLVYEYMSNRSLDAYIFDSHKQKFLDWQKRVIIIEGICRGLLYLHRDSRLRIIHRDLKADNILLDKELNPKISDFGMARIFGGKEEQANKTKVWIYALGGRFSEKSDVYNFGVLLLEIVSGMRNSNTLSLIDPLIYDPVMMRYAHVGLLCVQERAKDRPNISTVLSMIGSEIVELPHPTQPAFSVNHNSSQTESFEKIECKCSVNNVTMTIVLGR
ncbi:hypothetical protein Pfo_016300 [Paulownia fortunei]|nr:hypothetical protein Pfo_016300 [Paulownia fortunei]